MKKLYILMLIFISINIKAQTGTNIFSYGTNGDIIASATFAPDNMVSWRNNLVLSPYESFSIGSTDKTNTYRVILKTIGEPDPQSLGMFNSIEVYNSSNNEPILTLKNIESWVKPCGVGFNNTTGHFLTVPLSDKATALIFTGWCYDSTPSLTTIVVLKDGKATLVFNRNCNVLDFQQDAAHFSFTYANEYQEYYGKSDNPHPLDKDLKKFKVWKEGDLLKYAALN